MSDKQFFTLIGVAAVCVTAIAVIGKCVQTIVPCVLCSGDCDCDDYDCDICE